jgi:hypothetical protein
MPPAVFEPTILAGERPQTYALDGAVAGTWKGTEQPLLIYKHIDRFSIKLVVSAIPVGKLNVQENCQQRLH